MLGVWVQSLVKELKSHILHGQKTKILNRSNIVTNSIKTLKMIHIKKKKKDKATLKKKWRSGLGTVLRGYGWWLFLLLSSLTWSPCCPFLFPRFPLASHLPSSFREQMWTSSCGQPLGPCVQSGPWMRVSCCLDQRANWAIARWVACWHGKRGSTEKIDWLHQDKRWIPGNRKESLRETVPHTRGRQGWCGYEGRNDDMGNSWKSSV